MNKPPKPESSPPPRPTTAPSILSPPYSTHPHPLPSYATPPNSMYIVRRPPGQLAAFQGVCEAPKSESYGPCPARGPF